MERFEVRPAAVAGYGVLCGRVADDCRAVAECVGDNAAAGDGFDGLIMGQLRDIVDSFAEDTSSRVVQRAVLLDGAADELNESAWHYRSKDGASAAMFQTGYPVLSAEYRDFPDPTPFTYPGIGDTLTGFDPAEHVDGGFEELVDGVDTGPITGGLFEALDFIESALSLIDVEFSWKELTFGKLLGDEVTGDWNALKVCAGALDASGDALTEAANGLGSEAGGGGNLAALMGDWEGGAADAFRGHLTRLEAATRFDGQLARVVADIYRTAAELIKKTAEVTVELFTKIVEKLLHLASRLKLVELGFEFVEGMGKSVFDTLRSLPSAMAGRPTPPPTDPTEQIKEELRQEWEEVKGFYDEAKAICEAITSLPEQIQTAIDLATDPVDTMRTMTAEQVNEKLAPITDEVERFAGNVAGSGTDITAAEQLEEIEQSVDDLNTVLTSDALENAPTREYSTGARPRRP